MSWLFRAESYSSGGFLHEVVIPDGKPIFTVDSTSMSWLIPGIITIYPMEVECWQSADEILPVDSSPRPAGAEIPADNASAKGVGIPEAPLSRRCWPSSSCRLLAAG
jgi:hypothetical protein